MREPYGPRENVDTPGSRGSETPERFQPQRPLEQFIASTLSEIQQEQGRLYEKVTSATSKLDKLDEKVSTLNTHYTFVKGFGAALIFVIPLAGALLWYAVSDRIDRLIKLIDGRPPQAQQGMGSAPTGELPPKPVQPQPGLPTR